MIIHKIAPSVNYNYWLDTLLNKLTNQNAIKVLKVLNPANKKTLLLNFGGYCIKQPDVPSLLGDFDIVIYKWGFNYFSLDWSIQNLKGKHFSTIKFCLDTLFEPDFLNRCLYLGSIRWSVAYSSNNLFRHIRIVISISNFAWWFL